MKPSIIFLCKRRPQNKDLFNIPYGRFYHLSRYVAEAGFDVHLILADYAGGNTDTKVEGNLHIYSGSVKQPWKYLSLVNEVARSVNPGLFVGFSDIYFGLLARRYASKYHCKYIVDAYDDYESYIPQAKPLHFMWRSCLKRAHGITAAGPQLLEKMTVDNSTCAREVVPMAPDPVFYPRNREESRHELGLPAYKKLVGCAGSLARNRGVEILFEASQILSSTHPDIQMVLSGRILDNISVPPEILHLGFIEEEKVPLLVSALDLSVVIAQKNAFGSFSYPIKLYESMACSTPAVAANTEPNTWILHDNPGYLYEAGDGKSLADAIVRALENGDRFSFEKSSWEQSSEQFITCLNAVLEKG